MEDLFLLGVPLRGRRCVVLGSEEAALARARELHSRGALLELVAPAPSPPLRAWAHAEGVALTETVPQPEALVGVLLVVETEPDARDTEAWHRASLAGNFLYCAVDRPARCTFAHVAVVRRGPLQVAVSTSGSVPALAAWLRARLESALGEDVSDFVRALARLRASLPPSERRAALNAALARASVELRYTLPELQTSKREGE